MNIIKIGKNLVYIIGEIKRNNLSLQRGEISTSPAWGGFEEEETIMPRFFELSLKGFHALVHYLHQACGFCAK